MDGDAHHFRTGVRSVGPPMRPQDDFCRADVQDLVFAYLRIREEGRRAAALDIVRRLSAD